MNNNKMELIKKAERDNGMFKYALDTIRELELFLIQEKKAIEEREKLESLVITMNVTQIQLRKTIKTIKEKLNIIIKEQKGDRDGR